MITLCRTGTPDDGQIRVAAPQTKQRPAARGVFGAARHKFAEEKTMAQRRPRQKPGGALLRPAQALWEPRDPQPRARYRLPSLGRSHLHPLHHHVLNCELFRREPLRRRPCVRMGCPPASESCRGSRLNPWLAVGSSPEGAGPGTGIVREQRHILPRTEHAGRLGAVGSVGLKGHVLTTLSHAAV